MLIGSTAV